MSGEVPRRWQLSAVLVVERLLEFDGQVVRSRRADLHCLRRSLSENVTSNRMRMGSPDLSLMVEISSSTVFKWCSVASMKPVKFELSPAR